MVEELGGEVGDQKVWKLKGSLGFGVRAVGTVNILVWRFLLPPTSYLVSPENSSIQRWSAGVQCNQHAGSRKQRKGLCLDTQVYFIRLYFLRAGTAVPGAFCAAFQSVTRTVPWGWRRLLGLQKVRNPLQGREVSKDLDESPGVCGPEARSCPCAILSP